MNTENTIYYHRSIYDNLTFNLELSTEIGLHCGTLEQANKRPGKYLYELEVDTSNVCELNNALDTHWSGLDFLRELLSSKIIDSAKYTNYVKEFRAAAPYDGINENKYKAEFGRKILTELGYTGFIYPHRVEGGGNSLCIIEKSIIKNIKPITESCKKDWHTEFKLYETLWD